MNKKKWNRKDDIKLIELVEIYSQDWGMIARIFGDRNERDIENRYKDKLDPNVKNTKFTEEEDKLIVKLYEEFGHDWYAISKHFKSRNARMIKKRFQTVLRSNCKRSVRRKRNSEISTKCNSIANTPRNSSSSIPDKTSRASEDLFENYKGTFDTFYETVGQRSVEDDILSASCLNIDLFASYSTQIGNLDNYFNQLCVYKNEKNEKIEKTLQSQKN
jgi:hypothetical protein